MLGPLAAGRCMIVTPVRPRCRDGRLIVAQAPAGRVGIIILEMRAGRARRRLTGASAGGILAAAPRPYGGGILERGLDEVLVIDAQRRIARGILVTTTQPVPVQIGIGIPPVVITGMQPCRPRHQRRRHLPAALGPGQHRVPAIAADIGLPAAPAGADQRVGFILEMPLAQPQPASLLVAAMVLPEVVGDDDDQHHHHQRDDAP